jgi:histidinol-phosphate aminotransferase
VKTQDEKWFKKKLDAMRLLDSYAIEETVERIAQRFGISPLEIVKLNQNENFFLPKDMLRGLMQQVTEEYDPRIYPQDEEFRIKEKLSDYLKTPIDCLIIGNGGDEIIERIARLFLEKDDETISVTPTFSFYRLSANLVGAKHVEVPLKGDFSLDKEQILAMITSKTRLLFLCSPNNPTANQFSIDEVEFLLEEFPGVVIVDEAYVEFAEYSLLPLIEKYENLIILRTFSKAFGLAGLRLGYGVASSDLATILSKKAQLPYPVSSFALKVALKLLANSGIVEKAIRQLKDERGALTKELRKVNGVKAFDSQANFVLFQTDKQSDEVYQELLMRGIFVRNIKNPLLKNCLRTTVGLPEMNTKLLKTLQEVCGELK